MKTRIFSLALVTLTLTLAVATPSHAGEKGDLPEAPAKIDRPHYDNFLRELQLRHLNLTKWLNVIHPELVQLNYSKEEVSVLRKALQKRQVTRDQAESFCAKWLARYRENIDSHELYSFLMDRHENEIAASR